MNIPANLPSPDQENVYYSVSALETEFSKYFTQEKIKILTPTLRSYYYPTFVFDDSNSPNSYQLSIYPKEGSTETILLDEVGSIILDKAAISPPVNTPKIENLDDGGSTVIMDSSFYSNSQLKHSDFFTDLQIDTVTQTGLELILGVKYWEDLEYVNERAQFLEITRNIVSNRLKELPKEEMKALEEKLANIGTEIDAIVEVLERIADGQTESFDALQWENAVQLNYYLTPGNLPATKQFKGLLGTKSNLLQSSVDMITYRYGTNVNQVRRSDINMSASSDISVRDAAAAQDDSIGLSSTYGDFISNLMSPSSASTQAGQNNIGRTNSALTTEKLSKFPIEGDLPPFGRGAPNFEAVTEQMKSLVEFEGKEIFSEDGWLKDWYYNNFSMKILDKDPDFAKMENFLSGFQSLSNELSQVAQRDGLGGGRLLVLQAIFKSILKFCQSNGDVSEYAPIINADHRTNGSSIFEAMGRPSVLGPSKCHQYPSRYAQPALDDDDGPAEYSIESFSKTGFLVFAALDSYMSMIRNIPARSDAKAFLYRNLQTFHSDHDSVLALFNELSPPSMDSSGLMRHRKWSGNRWVYGNLSSTNSNGENTMKFSAHGYERNEEFYGTYPILVPAGDGFAPEEERTFFQFNIRGIAGVSEYNYRELVKQEDEQMTGVKTVGDDHPEILTGMNSDYPHRYNEDATYPEAWKQMGWVNRNQIDGIAWLVNLKRTNPVHYGVYDPDTTKEDWFGPPDLANTFDFWKHKNYNFPYFWASCVSINRALVIEAYRFLSESVQEITGAEFDLSDEFILANMDVNRMFNAILQVTRKLRVENDNGLGFWAMGDGCLTFFNGNVEGAFNNRVKNTLFTNTVGFQTTKLVKDYAKFVSLCSSEKSVKIENDHKLMEFDSGAYIPPEVLTEKSNQNFKNGHGGSGAYIANNFQNYYDQLVFKKQELINGIPIRKNYTALGPYNVFESTIKGWMKDTRNLRSHSFLHEHVINSFAGFRSYIEGFIVGDAVKSIFLEGHFDAQEDIRKPRQLSLQIANNKILYSPNANYISGRYTDIKMQDSQLNVNENEILYIYVLGIEKESWADEETMIRVVPEYYGTGPAVRIDSATKSFNFYRPQIFDDSSYDDETTSRWALNYLHLARGLFIDELTFSKKKDLIYEKEIIESKSGVFPWSKEDFEDNNPTIEIDPLFNMSPLVFPRNYFYDVCLENKFQRVVGVVLTSKDLENIPIETINEGNSIEDIIGSIRWVVV